jgi:8-oxo-dGTP pyrophosphatase MutT (NUDIX family)
MIGTVEAVRRQFRPMSLHPLESRLRSALRNTHDRAPRPLSSLELPLGVERLLTPALVRSLKPAAVLIPVLREAAGPRVLLTRRADHLRKHSGQISFPGGRRDPEDRDAAANALREAQEEVGMQPADVDVIGYLDDYPTITGYRVTPVVGVVTRTQAWRLDPGEVAGIFETPLAYVLDEQNYERKAFSRSGVNVPFFELNFRNGETLHRIWGATAGMLWDLARKVRAHHLEDA